VRALVPAGRLRIQEGLRFLSDDLIRPIFHGIQTELRPTSPECQIRLCAGDKFPAEPAIFLNLKFFIPQFPDALEVVVLSSRIPLDRAAQSVNRGSQSSVEIGAALLKLGPLVFVLGMALAEPA